MPKIEAQTHQIIKDLETAPSGFNPNGKMNLKNLTITRSRLKTIIYSHWFIGPIWPDSIKKMSTRTKIGRIFITRSLYQWKKKKKKKKEIGRQIVKCKLAYTNESANRADKSGRAN